ncbi:Protein of unknown function, partial [Gryllus bimaculatus]
VRGWSLLRVTRDPIPGMKMISATREGSSPAARLVGGEEVSDSMNLQGGRVRDGWGVGSGGPEEGQEAVVHFQGEKPVDSGEAVADSGVEKAVGSGEGVVDSGVEKAVDSGEGVVDPRM